MEPSVKYEVYINGEKKKEYDHKIQAQTWLAMNGYLVSGKGYIWTNPDAEIKEVIVKDDFS